MAGGTGKSSPGHAAQLVALGTMLFACVAVGLAAGYFADRWLGTQPWLVLVGLAFGIAAAAVNFFRTIKTLNETDRSNGHG
jgi:ATP synthase protein I